MYLVFIRNYTTNQWECTRIIYPDYETANDSTDIKCSYLILELGKTMAKVLEVDNSEASDTIEYNQLFPGFN